MVNKEKTCNMDNLIKTKKNIKTICHIKKYIFFAVKRIFDIIFALIGCILLVPATLIIKICYVVARDCNPIIYKQQRIGKNGKKIYIYKYRSMIYNADSQLAEVLRDEKYKKEWECSQKIEDDPRITKIGRILRKTSIDEMPQFINVLKGDMSIIGPRPLVEGELDAHQGNHEIYESVRPGITGLWAAKGRSTTTYQKRLELEYYYCNNIGLKMDIKCLLRTVIAVVLKIGAM